MTDAPTAARSTLSLSDLATKIKDNLEKINSATNRSLDYAVEVGEWMTEAKAQVEHGKWGDWLERNCKLKERTAQRYMKLATKKELLKRKMKSDSMTDLTITAALELLADGGSSGGGKGHSNASDAYDNLAARLIKKLKSLPPDEADAAATATIKELKDAVAEIKQIAKAVKAA